MPCPHGNGPATQCSQCLGAVPIRIDLQGGRIFVDGVAKHTAAQQMTQAEETTFSKPALRRGGKAPRACSRCGIAGHNAKTCGRGG